MLVRRLTKLATILNVVHSSCSSHAMSSAAGGGLSEGCVGAPALPGSKLPLAGDESLMKPKAFGTTAAPVQADLRWGIPNALASRICSYNRHYAEPSGSWLGTFFLKEVDRAGATTFYDSVTGRPLFVAPRGRSFEEWERESRAHGWPSFRDEEVVWDDVRVLPDGEAVSLAGTHLGHNLPDKKGNRYCINLCSVAGRPVGEK
jgi:peptide methionine sulfoxide reductase MsrB